MGRALMSPQSLLHGEFFGTQRKIKRITHVPRAIVIAVVVAAAVIINRRGNHVIATLISIHAPSLVQSTRAAAMASHLNHAFRCHYSRLKKKRSHTTALFCTVTWSKALL